MTVAGVAGWMGRRAAYRGPLVPVLVALALVLAHPSALVAVSANGLTYPSPDDEAPEDASMQAQWSLDLGDGTLPVSQDAGFSVLHPARSGRVLMAGLTDGGLLFVDPSSGEVEASWSFVGHGPVRSVSSDDAGRRAVVVHEDGHVAAVDSGQGEVLMSRFDDDGAPGEVAGRVGAVMARDGGTLVVAAQDLSVYEAVGDVPDARFERSARHAAAVGPHLFVHPVLPVLAAMDDEGRIAVFDLDLQPQYPPVSLVDHPVAMAVSPQGDAFAVLTSAGRVLRYEVRVIATGPDLLLEYEGQVRCDGDDCGPAFGVALDRTGGRMMAWTSQEVLWVEGNNRNVAQDEAKRTDEADTVRLVRPVDRSWSVGRVSPDRNLTRAVVTQVDASGSAVPALVLFPSLDQSDAFLGGTSDAQGAALSPSGSLVFTTSGRVLAAFGVGPVGDPGGGSAGDGLLAGLPLSLMVASLGGLLALVVLSILVMGFVSMRRVDESRLIERLSLDEEPEYKPRGNRPGLPGGGTRGHVRLVVPSAPPEPEPPEGLLALQDFTVRGAPSLVGLRLSLSRPGVVRLTGDRRDLALLRAALAGHVPARGTASAGGVDRAATPVLFARHLRVGLPLPEDASASARRWFEGEGGKLGVPGAVVARRLESDLGWMGRRLDAPFVSLAPVDQWKLRLAVALLGRPSALIVWTEELPVAGEVDATEVVRRVLQGVARRNGMLVVLLDPGGPVPQQTVRAWAHMELRLLRHGFTDQVLLDDGQVVGSTGPVNTAGAGSAGSGNGAAGVARGEARGPRATTGK